MEITTRALTDSERQRSVWIETGAIKGLAYVDDVWDLFTKKSQGEFTGAYIDGELCGIGKLTKLYGEFGWLETLRVHPDFQLRGLGKAIYKRYFEQTEELGISAVGMYTGFDNVVSKGLAEKNGLSLKGRFSEYIYTLENENIENADDFHLVQKEKGEEILENFYDETGGFVVINRTFYPVKKGIGEYFAQNGWLFADGCGNIVVTGARFQPEKAIHIPFMKGDTSKIMNFVKKIALEKNSKTISAIRFYDDIKEEQTLNYLKFDKSKFDLITLWKGI